MIPFTVRPATRQDVATCRDRLPGIMPDCWAPGGNRRSFVATTPEGQVVGNCHGVDNHLHPSSRRMSMQIDPQWYGTGVRDLLLTAQLGASTLPLQFKVTGDDDYAQRLALRHGAVAVQVTPPWRFRVDEQLRAWAASVGGAVDTLTPADKAAVQALEAEHYVADELAWRPDCSPEVLRAQYVAGHHPDDQDHPDHARSVVLRRDGRLVAAALVWPEEEPGDGCEVSLVTAPHEGPEADLARRQCLAAVISRTPLGDELLVEAPMHHRSRFELVRSLPGMRLGDDSHWAAVVAIPTPGHRVQHHLDASLVPDEAAWIRALLP